MIRLQYLLDQSPLKYVYFFPPFPPGVPPLNQPKRNRKDEAGSGRGSGSPGVLAASKIWKPSKKKVAANPPKKT